MRYLIFGDVHGNLPALEKLLKTERGNYDVLVSHGDVVNYGPWSNECVELLSGIPEGIVTLKGNHETNFLNGSYNGENITARTFFNFCYPKFTNSEIIKNYGESYDLEDFEVKHTIDDRYIYPDTDLSQFKLVKNYIIGHSHYQFDRFSNGRRIINTGSVGQNRKTINVAEYVMYDDVQKTIGIKSFDYNIDTVINKMESENYPQLCVDYYRNKNRR